MRTIGTLLPTELSEEVLQRALLAEGLPAEATAYCMTEEEEYDYEEDGW